MPRARALSPDPHFSSAQARGGGVEQAAPAAIQRRDKRPPLRGNLRIQVARPRPVGRVRDVHAIEHRQRLANQLAVVIVPDRRLRRGNHPHPLGLVHRDVRPPPHGNDVVVGIDNPGPQLQEGVALGQRKIELIDHAADALELVQAQDRSFAVVGDHPRRENRRTGIAANARKSRRSIPLRR